MSEAEVSVEAELSEKTEVSQRKREGRQDYLKRLVVGISKLDDDEWEGLSKDAQQWANDATTAEKDGEEIPDFEGASANGEAEPEPEDTWKSSFSA